MLRIAADGSGRRLMLFGRPPAGSSDNGSAQDAPDWTRVRPATIRSTLERAQALPAGGWYVLDGSRQIRERPSFYWVAGREVVAWRMDGVARAAPNACPHMSAPLSEGRVRHGRLVCPWHGLELAAKRHGAWAPLPTCDDGVLTWVRLEDGDPATDRPILAQRPARYIEGTIRRVARCEPGDVLANRLDPWHGAHFHPHTFARLRVLDETDDVLRVRVAFRVLGRFCVEVDCTFHCPERRTIVMTIVDGEGVGSVVETHATPLAPGYTAVIETTLATSERIGFALARRASFVVRPFIERAAGRLWVEDAAYAERASYLRRGDDPARWIAESGPTVSPGARVQP